jgi:hypothetical protein
MRFKEAHMQAQYFSRPTRLLDVCRYFAELSEEMGIEPVVTRVTDTVPGESGVHPAGRAVDFRDESGGSRLYTDEQAADIVKAINEKFPRDDGKPTCMHHGFQGGPLHFHIQIPFCWLRKSEIGKTA